MNEMIQALKKCVSILIALLIVIQSFPLTGFARPALSDELLEIEAIDEIAVLSSPSNLEIGAVTPYSIEVIWDAPEFIYAGAGNVTYNLQIAAADGSFRSFENVVSPFEILALDYATNYDIKVFAVQSGVLSLPARISTWTTNYIDFDNVVNRWGPGLNEMGLGNPMPPPGGGANSDSWFARAPHLTELPLNTGAVGARAIPFSIFSWTWGQLFLTQEADNTFLRLNRPLPNTGNVQPSINLPLMPQVGEMSFNFRTDEQTNEGMQIRLRGNNPAQNNRRHIAEFFFTENNELGFRRNTNAPHMWSGAQTWVNQGGTVNLPANEWVVFHVSWDFQTPGARTISAFVEDLNGNIIHDFGSGAMPNVAIDGPNHLNIETGALAFGTSDIDLITFGSRNIVQDGTQAVDIPITAVSINGPANNEIRLGQTFGLTTTIAPVNTWNSLVNWTSSDESVLSVDVNGRIVPIGVGIATITATSRTTPTVYNAITISVNEMLEPDPIVEGVEVVLATPYSLIVDWDSSEVVNSNGGVITYSLTIAPAGGDVQTFTNVVAPFEIAPLTHSTHYDIKVFATQNNGINMVGRTSAWTTNYINFDNVVNRWGRTLNQNAQPPTPAPGFTGNRDTWFARAPHLDELTVNQGIAPTGQATPFSIFSWVSAGALLYMDQENADNTFLRFNRPTGIGAAPQGGINLPDMGLIGEMSFNFRTDHLNDEGMYIAIRVNNPNQNQRMHLARFNFIGNSQVTFQRNTGTPQNWGGAQTWTGQGGTATILENEWMVFRIIWDFTVGTRHIRAVIEDLDGNIIHDFGQAAMPNVELTAPNHLAINVAGNTFGRKDIDMITFGPRNVNRPDAPANDVPVVAVEINGPEDNVIELNSTFGLSTTLTPANAWDSMVTWESSDESVIEIHENGLIRGTNIGYAYITARSVQNPNVYDVIRIEVVDEILTAITFERPVITVHVGEYARVRELGTPLTWPARDSFVPATLTSENVETAEIRNNGFVYGITPGTTVVNAQRGSDYGSVIIEVLPARSDEFDIMRRNYRDFHLPFADPLSPGGMERIEIFDESAAIQLESMNRNFNPGWAGRPWHITGGDGTNGGNIETSQLWSNLRPIINAFTTPGSSFYLCPETFDTIERTLRWNLDNVMIGPLTPAMSNMLNELYPVAGPNATAESIAMNAMLRQPAPIRSSNWWHWGIGYPNNVITQLVLMYEFGLADELMQAYVRRLYINTPTHLTGSGGGTPSHQTYRTFFVLISGILGRDEDRVNMATNAFMTGGQFPQRSGLLPITGSGANPGSHGDGYYWDGSNIGHTHYATQFAYGIGIINSMTRFTATTAYATLNGQPLTFDDELFDLRMQSITNSYLPGVWRGVGMPSLAGRSVSRVAHSSGSAGGVAMAGIIAEFVPHLAPDAQIEALQNLNSWAIHNPELLSGANIRRVDNMNAIVNNPNITPRESTGIFAQNHASRLIYRNENFAFNIAFNNFNANTAPNTSVNNENMRAVHSGEGMTYLFLHNDQYQYADDFFATVNMQRLPGTTVEMRPDLNWTGNVNSSRNPNQTMGATAVMRDIDGEFATTTFRQNFTGNTTPNRDSDLRANNSWFMIDGRIIALGTGITGTSAGRPVSTVVDQRRIPTGSVESFVINSSPAGIYSNNGITSSDSWIHLAYTGSAATRGVGIGDGIAQIGYFIPEGQSLSIGTQLNHGSWRENNVNGPTDILTDLYAQIFIDHGEAPTNSWFEYVLLPNFTQDQVEAFAAAQASDNPIYEIVANENTLHAIYDHTLNILMINNFDYLPATVISPATGITYTISTAGTAIIREFDGGELSVSLHDPTGVNNTITLTIADHRGTRISGDGNMTVAPSGDDVVITASQLTSFEGRRFDTWNVEVVVIALDADIDEPQAPINAEISNETYFSLNLTWDSPATIADYANPEFIIRWQHLGEDMMRIVPANATSARIFPLSRGIQYEFSITTMTFGVESQSLTITGTTLNYEPTITFADTFPGDTIIDGMLGNVTGWTFANAGTDANTHQIVADGAGRALEIRSTTTNSRSDVYYSFPEPLTTGLVEISMSARTPIDIDGALGAINLMGMVNGEERQVVTVMAQNPNTAWTFETQSNVTGGNNTPVAHVAANMNEWVEIRMIVDIDNQLVTVLIDDEILVLETPFRFRTGTSLDSPIFPADYGAITGLRLSTRNGGASALQIRNIFVPRASSEVEIPEIEVEVGADGVLFITTPNSDYTYSAVDGNLIITVPIGSDTDIATIMPSNWTIYNRNEATRTIVIAPPPGYEVVRDETTGNLIVRLITTEITYLTYTFDWQISDVANITAQVQSGFAPTAPTEIPANPGYIFLGWNPVVGPITENTTFIAQWVNEELIPTYVSYTFDWQIDGVQNQTGLVRAGLTPTAPTEIPQKPGYTFTGFTPALGPIIVDTTFVANWQPENQITPNEIIRITVSPEGIITLIMPSGNFNYTTVNGNLIITIPAGTSIDIPVELPNGWAVINREATTKTITITPPTNYEIYQRPTGELALRRIKLTINFTVENSYGGTVAAYINGEAITTGEEIPAGSDVLFVATATTGHQVRRWLVNNEQPRVRAQVESTLLIQNITTNTQVSVEFELITNQTDPTSPVRPTNPSVPSTPPPPPIPDDLPDSQTSTTTTTDDWQEETSINNEEEASTTDALRTQNLPQTGTAAHISLTLIGVGQLTTAVIIAKKRRIK